MIDEHGFRLNVGIVLANCEGRLFWGKRVGKMNAWQFPQGGIHEHEDLYEAMYRELKEELGLQPNDVRVMGITSDWVHYHLPKHLRRYSYKPLCIGQKQKWFMLELMSHDEAIRFDSSNEPEFEEWKWVDYWRPLQEVIAFKKDVYQKVLEEFAPLVIT